jgi:hypothetical protein
MGLVGSSVEGLGGGEDIDSDAEERGGDRDDAEAAANDEERVRAACAWGPLALPQRIPAVAQRGGRRGPGGGRRRL